MGSVGGNIQKRNCQLPAWWLPCWQGQWNMVIVVIDKFCIFVNTVIKLKWQLLEIVIMQFYPNLWQSHPFPSQFQVPPPLLLELALLESHPVPTNQTWSKETPASKWSLSQSLPLLTWSLSSDKLLDRHLQEHWGKAQVLQGVAGNSYHNARWFSCQGSNGTQLASALFLGSGPLF